MTTPKTPAMPSALISIETLKCEGGCAPAQGQEVDASNEWIEDSKKYHGKVLTGKFAHWCLEWDDLPIDETCPEFKVCLCFPTEEVKDQKEILDKAFPSESDIDGLEKTLENFAWYSNEHQNRDDIIIKSTELSCLLQAARLYAAQATAQAITVEELEAMKWTLKADASYDATEMQYIVNTRNQTLDEVIAAVKAKGV